VKRPELKIEMWPPSPETGMSTGRLPAGVKITHLPTGESVVCTHYRHPHKNKSAALKQLRQKLTIPNLPFDDARCVGVGNDQEGWRTGCEVCLRRLSPGNPLDQWHTDPPELVNGECELIIRIEK
jgi:Protein chain release factor A